MPYANSSGLRRGEFRDLSPEDLAEQLDANYNALRDARNILGKWVTYVDIPDETAASMTAVARDCLQVHGRTHQGVARAGCALLAEYAHLACEEALQRAAEAGLAEAVIGAMRAFPRSLELQKPACCVFSFLLSRSARACELMLAAGGVEAVAAALTAAAR